jgi:hypothetical protein
MKIPIPTGVAVAAFLAASPAVHAQPYLCSSGGVYWYSMNCPIGSSQSNTGYVPHGLLPTEPHAPTNDHSMEGRRYEVTTESLVCLKLEDFLGFARLGQKAAGKTKASPERKAFQRRGDQLVHSDVCEVVIAKAPVKIKRSRITDKGEGLFCVEIWNNRPCYWIGARDVNEVTLPRNQPLGVAPTYREITKKVADILAKSDWCGASVVLLGALQGR